jgi:hypothetical protein
MRIVITGGAGFLGVRLARALLARDTLTDAKGVARPLRELVLLDVAPPPDLGDRRVRAVTGDLADRDVIERAVTADTDSIFHLAAVVSGQAEADFDIGMRVNLDATRLLLERCRRLAAPPKFVFASSLAVFGGPAARSRPRRRAADAAGFLRDAKGNRRAPGLRHDAQRASSTDAACGCRPSRCGPASRTRRRPRSRAASFASPCPASMRSARSRDRRRCGSRRRARWSRTSSRSRSAGSAFAHTRSVNVPGILVPVEDMVAALRKVAGDEVADRVKWEFDPAIDRIVCTWASNFAPKLGYALGMTSDSDFEGIVRAYIADDKPR